MEDSKINKAETANLAGLFQLGPADTPLWQDDELEAIFRHQLQTPLDLELREFDPITTNQLMKDSSGCWPKTFAELFAQSEPRIELLELTKRYAKSCAASKTGNLPPDVAGVLYVCCIAAAMYRRAQRITTWNDEALCDKLRWAGERSWINEPIRTLLFDTLDALQ